MTEDEVISLYQQHGWNDINAIRGDIAAGHWQDKVNGWLATSSGGSSDATSGGVEIQPFSWTAEQQSAAEAKALAELTPYYTKLLQMYGGDVALAKQRIDQDYERGLRVKTENTEWAKEGYDQSIAERQRKFKIALNDIDQSMNQRGLFNSGIRTTERERATADEAYQQGLLAREKTALDTGLAQYKEGTDVDYRRAMEEKGYLKPTTTAVTGEYAPSTAGQISRPSYTISNYVPETEQKQWQLEQEKLAKIQERALATRNQAYEQWAADATRLARMA